jgi:hypothetical protein
MPTPTDRRPVAIQPTDHPEFSVYWWDAENNYHRELSHVAVMKALQACKRLTQGPAARMGMVNRVMITDGGDCCVFEWQKGQGIVWPKVTANE